MVTKDNPLLHASTHPFEAFDFLALNENHYLPAFEHALNESRQRVRVIAESTTHPTFENTIEALECADERLAPVQSVFGSLLHAHTSPAMQSMAREILPKLAEYSNDIFLNEKLFNRIEIVWNDALNHAPSDPHSARGEPTAEAKRLLHNTYRAFVRNGAGLTLDKKDVLRRIDGELAVKTQLFGDHVLAATQAFEHYTDRESDLGGLPESARTAARALAVARGKGSEGWLFTLDAPSSIPVLKYAEDRALREKIWRAQTTRATSGESDNRNLTREIAVLRHQRALLLGFETHAHYTLSERMAKNPEHVMGFLGRLLRACRGAGDRELAQVKKLAAELGLSSADFKPWDMAFYSEKYRRKMLDFDEEALRPYFKLENVLNGVFEHARRLYGLEFKLRKDLPTYHPDVAVYEVHDPKQKTGPDLDPTFAGLLYTDFFPRPNKRPGAWMTVFRDQGLA
ncbi:MAG: M3 family metallopeptidase, partial [Bdellovibrionota bacterium]